MRFPTTFVVSEEARELQKRIESKISAYVHSAWYKKGEGIVGNGHGKGLLTTSAETEDVKNSVSQELLRKLEELATYVVCFQILIVCPVHEDIDLFLYSGKFSLVLFSLRRAPKRKINSRKS